MAEDDEAELIRATFDGGEASSEYLRTDEFDDLADVVRSASVLARALPDNLRHARCILSELVNAFGIAMICALHRTDGGGIWRNDDEARLHAHNESRRNAEFPKGMQIASPSVLWLRAKDDGWMASWGGSPITTSPRREELISFAFELRDEFHHFRPKTWSIHRQDMIEAALEMVKLLRELSGHASFVHRLNGEASASFQADLLSIETALESVE